MDKLLIICGPTATGKTKLALDLASKFNGEVVSADSRQVYKGLDILTGKDLLLNAKCQMLNAKFKYRAKSYQLPFYEINGIKLWMYDVVDFGEEFSVGHYQALAMQIIKEIQRRGKLPIIVGGTGLYLRALTQDLSTIHIPPDTDLRNKLYQESVLQLQDDLKKVDLHKWENMNNSDRNNPRRLVRAIEIANWNKNHRTENQNLLKTDILWLGLIAPLPILKKGIKNRVKARWKSGALTEVKSLKPKVNRLPPILGLKPIQDFLAGRTQINDAITEWSNSEFAYAKRQITWFKKQPNIRWFDVTDLDYIQKVGTDVRRWYTNK